MSLPPDLLDRGAHTLTVCNACRYCEQFCPVFPALEQRRTFHASDLSYLANLCHNCGECLYACQFAPPHPFGINVPRTLAEVRGASYRSHAWPQALAARCRTAPVALSLVLAFGFSLVLLAAVAVADPARLWIADGHGDFYAVIPHDVLVAIFGSVGAFAAATLGIGLMRFVREIGMPAGSLTTDLRAFREAVTLRHLHSSGANCVSAEEERWPWRRWWHHAALWGLALCLVSTTVAAAYHSVFGWRAPYALWSAPVLLGSAGGVGLLAGSLGLWVLRGRRDPLLGDPAQRGDDTALLLSLMATSLTGLALLAFRATPAMTLLLVVHLGWVLTFFLLVPYGKFVHGFYRLAALRMFGRERSGAL